jgi:signal transduction histidine kinase
MKPESLRSLQEGCSSAAVFERIRQILHHAVADAPPAERQVLQLLASTTETLLALDSPAQLAFLTQQATALLNPPDSAALVMLRKQAKQEHLMAMIAQRIRQSLDLQDILNTTVSEVRQFLNTDRVVIYRFESTGEGTVTAESVDVPWRSLVGITLNATWFKQRLSDYRQGKCLIVPDVQALDPHDGLRKFWHRLQVRAGVSLPIVHGGNLWGILVAHQCSRARQWEALEIDLLEQLAIQVAIALEQSERYGQVQQLNADLEVQVRERTAELQQALGFEAMLKRITDAVRDSLDESKILQAAVQELADGLGADACDAALHNAEQHTSTICYEHIRANISPATGVCLEMANMPEVYQQILSGQYFQFCPAEYNLIRPTITRNHAILACPMMDDQGVVGDLWVFKPTDYAFTMLEIRLVQQVANQCAIGIRQARLYQAAQAQVAALEELNQFKDDFLSTVSHELRTPVSNMKMAIHMLRRIPTPDRQTTYLDILENECSREIALINDLLDLQRLEAKSYHVSLEPLDVRDVVLDLIQPFQERTGARQQVLTLDLAQDLPILHTDKAGFERVLAELLHNACKYTSPAGKIHLEVGVSGLTAGKTVLIRIGNQADIPAAELTKVFDKFYRLPNGDRWKQGGTGLGLTLVQRLIAELGGQISVSSSQGWTEFSVEL